MARRYNLRRVKIHRSYSVSEVGRLLEVHKHTVSRWIASGLPLIDQRRPYLVHGTDLRKFLAARQPRKQPSRPGEIYCVRCRAPKRPACDMAEYQPQTASTGALIGICPTCERLIHRFVAPAHIERASGDLEVTRRSPERRLTDSSGPFPNVDFDQEKPR